MNQVKPNIRKQQQRIIAAHTRGSYYLEQQSALLHTFGLVPQLDVQHVFSIGNHKKLKLCNLIEPYILQRVN